MNRMAPPLAQSATAARQGAESPWVVRPANSSDVDALYELASHTDGGLLNLPHDRDALKARLGWSEASFARQLEAPENELYFLVLENEDTGAIGGCACVFSRIGVPWPFYSYKIATHTHVSRELSHSFAARLLHIVNDFDGAAEVGGLFLHPDHRSGGLGALLARSRYLFIAQHRERFPDRIIADLRGYVGPDGSPFWNAIGRIFFGRDFREADHYNALHGNQFIADLMPRYPIYVDLLPKAARECIGRAHDQAIPARRILEAEGFSHDGYIDIFDGGPTLSAQIANLRTLRESREAVVTDTLSPDENGGAALVTSGALKSFRVWRDFLVDDGGEARLLTARRAGVGAAIRYVA